MSVLTVLAAIPCVGSLKRADTIIKELATQGLAIDKRVLADTTESRVADNATGVPDAVLRMADKAVIRWEEER